ncbi:MAG: hypothetical protein IT324_17525 [Anaerolineae bacterium]|nr:hypothetical protein [Anaerolineae bacterium]
MNHMDQERTLDDLISAVQANETLPEMVASDSDRLVIRLTEQAQAIRMDTRFAAQLESQLRRKQLATNQTNTVPTGDRQIQRARKPTPLATLAALAAVLIFAVVLFRLIELQETAPVALSGSTETPTPLPTMEPTLVPPVVKPPETPTGVTIGIGTIPPGVVATVVPPITVDAVTSTPFPLTTRGAASGDPVEPTVVPPVSLETVTSTPFPFATRGAASGDPVEPTVVPPGGKPIEQLRLLAYSPDGKRLAVAGCAKPAGANCLESKVRIWDMAQNRAMGIEVSPGPIVYNVVFSPDGQILAIAGCGKQNDEGRCVQGQVWLLDMEHGTLDDQLLAGDNNAAYAVQFVGNSQTVVATSLDGTLWLWDRARKRVVKQAFGEYAPNLVSAAFSPDGRLFAFQDAQFAMRIWDVAAEQFVGEPLTGFKGNVADMAFTPDNRALAIAGPGDQIQVRQINTGYPISLLMERITPVTGLLFGPDGKTLAAIGVDGTVRLWDASSAQPMGEAHNVDDSPVSRLAFSPDGKTLVTATVTGTVRVWNLASQPYTNRLLEAQ